MSAPSRVRCRPRIATDSRLALGSSRGRTLALLVGAVACGLSAAGLASAADPAPPAPAVTVSAAVTGLHAFPSDLEGGGTVDWSGASISASVRRQFVPAFSAALSLAYDRQEWDFDSATKFGGAAPWMFLQRPGVGLNLSLALSPTVLVGVSPAAEWPSAEGAFAGTSTNADDALTYGATFSALKKFSSKLVLGGGAKVQRQFYMVKTSPFVIVNWQITERLRIANAISAGPLGGGGVELRYAPDARWEFAGGGVMRSDRFRLTDRGRYSNGVVEAGGMPLFARVSRTAGANARIDLYAGALLDGSVKVRDADGHELVKEPFAAAPTLALTLSRKR